MQPEYIKLQPESTTIEPETFSTLTQVTHQDGIKIIAHQTEDPKQIAALWRAGADLILDNFIPGIDDKRSLTE